MQAQDKYRNNRNAIEELSEIYYSIIMDIFHEPKTKIAKIIQLYNQIYCVELLQQVLSLMYTLQN